MGSLYLNMWNKKGCPKGLSPRVLFGMHPKRLCGIKLTLWCYAIYIRDEKFAVQIKENKGRRIVRESQGVATKQNWRRRHADRVTALRKGTPQEGRTHKQTWRLNNAEVFASTPAAAHRPITRLDVEDETRLVPAGTSNPHVVSEAATATQNI
jgi:hypothetical protein